jgi:transcriptional regulator with XRE-family HTH domain
MKNRIKELREKKGLSQTQLAQLVDSTQTIVSKIENGKQSLTTEQLARFAAVLEVHPSELVDDPQWNRTPLSQLNEPLLRVISQAVVKAARKQPQLTDTDAAAVIASLYRQYAPKQGAHVAQAEHIEADAELLVAHELAKRV